MNALADIYAEKKEMENAVHWWRRGAEAGLPTAMFSYGVGLGRKCSKCPSTQFKPSILELNSII